MVSIDYIMKEIDSLNYETKKELYNKLKTDLLREKRKLVDLEKYRGKAKHVWDNAKQYVDELRDNDRL